MNNNNINNALGGLFAGLEEMITAAVEKAVESKLREIVVTADEEEKRLTRQELAARWSVTLPTLNSYVKAGKVTPIKLGRRVVFSLSEIKKAEAKGLRRYTHN